jgi:alkylhydroperoxidase/carboxymuconolactone decarboxylase family protein YurZ
MTDNVPEQVAEVRDRYPEIWEAFARLADACHQHGGPLDERSRKLAKLAIAIGHRHEGAVHSAARQALAAGLQPEELHHVALLAVTTIGWPAARAALSWIDDVLGGISTSAGNSEVVNRLFD